MALPDFAAASRTDDRVLSEVPGLLSAVFISSPDAILVKTLDGIIANWNPAAQHLFGYTPEEMIGQPILRLIPAHRQAEEQEIIGRAAAGEPVPLYRTTRLAKDGREIAISLLLPSACNGQVEILRAAPAALDSSDPGQAQTAAFRLATIVESSDDAILSKDLNGIITSWNQAAARLFGYSADEIVGCSILKLIPLELHAQEREILAQLHRGKRIQHFETMRLRKDGQQFPVSLTISPVKDASGRIIGASKILRDISERQKLEQSLMQAEKLAATGRMAASIAHEINNPLEALLNLIFLARENAENTAEVRTFLTAAEGEVARVSHLARQTLGYYREQSSPTRIAVCDLLRDAVQFYEPRLNAAKISIVRDFDCDYAVMLKRGEMMQVVSNLIANAIHAMPEGGVLRVAIHPATRTLADTTQLSGILISIEDNGSGILEENRPRVFEPFFTTRGSVGTGIGLWVARQFVEAHGGSLDLWSSVDPADHGTRMSIFLPFQNPYSDSTPPPQSRDVAFVN